MFRIYIMAASLIFLTAIGCNNVEDMPDRDELEAEKEKIENVLVTFFRAINEKDWQLFEETVRLDWKYYDSGGNIFTHDEFIDATENITEYEAEVTELEIHFSDDMSMAVVGYQGETVYRVNDEVRDFYGFRTTVLNKENDRWVIIHHHL